MSVPPSGWRHGSAVPALPGIRQARRDALLARKARQRGSDAWFFVTEAYRDLPRVWERSSDLKGFSRREKIENSKIWGLRATRKCVLIITSGELRMGWPLCESQPLEWGLSHEGLSGVVTLPQRDTESARIRKQGALKRKYCVAIPVQEDECWSAACSQLDNRSCLIPNPARGRLRKHSWLRFKKIKGIKHWRKIHQNVNDD